MRVNATLTALQKAGGDAICKIVFGDDAYIYGVDTTNRILDLKHPEQEWSQTAQVAVDNRDTNLTALDLEGYKGVISYGFDSTYSACAPLTVIAQKADSMQGELVTSFSLAGLFNMWAEQEATEAYTPEDTNGDTVKIILDAIASHSMTCFGSYPVHTITYETTAAGYDANYDDSIINAFKPRDYFFIAKGESRLSAFQKALRYTKCKALVRNDSGTATIHIFQPLITGETYHYEYNDAVTEHNFFNKSKRTRLVLPNRVVVMNHPDHEDSYTGSAVDTDSYGALGNQYYTETHYLRTSGNTECGRIATAILQGYQIAAEIGHAYAPMNCGQEVMDYVKITDSKVSTTASEQVRIGNIGFLERHYRPGLFNFEFRFGSLYLAGLAGTMSPRTIVTTPSPDYRVSIQSLIDAVSGLYDYVDQLKDNQATIINYLLAREEVVPKWHVTEQLIIPVWIPIAPIVTAEDVSDIHANDATGNGTITDLGVPNPTAHGVCWNKTGSPNVDDDTVKNVGAVTETGAFTALMESLDANTDYYVRAYATNTTGTGYGTEVDFTTLAS